MERYGSRPYGKEKGMSLGSLKDVTLKEARELRDKALKFLDKGIDPSSHRRTLRARHDLDNPDSFENVAREWLEGRAVKWSPSTTIQNTTRLEQMIFPWLGSRPIEEISAPEILQNLKRIEGRGAHETAHRVKSLMARVFQYAVSTGRAQRNPVADIGSEALTKPKTKHFGAITDPIEVGELLRAIDKYRGTVIVRSALAFSPHVFLRPKELRFAEWSEFALESNLWRVPAERMKLGEDHLVPLSKQATAILEDLRPLTGGGRFVFRGARSASRCMSSDTIRMAFQRMGYESGAMTAHGFRTMASTILHESGWNSDVIERQLSHKEGNQVKEAYNRARHLPERQKMMQTWSDYLDALKQGADVIPFNRNASKGG